MLSEISPVTHRQGELLESETTTNSRLMLALDSLNQRYGCGPVKVSTQGRSRTGRCGRSAGRRTTPPAGKRSL